VSKFNNHLDYLIDNVSSWVEPKAFRMNQNTYTTFLGDFNLNQTSKWGYKNIPYRIDNSVPDGEIYLIGDDEYADAVGD